MKPLWRFRWLWIGLIAIAAVLACIGLFLRYETVNEMHPALDQLASVSLSERWSHPAMVRIRQLGPAVVPPLCRVLREKDQPTTRFLLWLKAKWPPIAKLWPNLPDPKKMTERRWTACQVLQTLGPAAKAAVPDLVRVIESKDPGEVNGGVMALWAVGIDSDACEWLDQSLEQGKAAFGRSAIVDALGRVTPPSTRTLHALTKSLADPSPYVQQHAAQTLGRLGVATPEVLSEIKTLQTSSTNDLTTVTCLMALWQLKQDPSAAAGVLQLLQRLVQSPVPPPLGGGNGGQAIDELEQVFLKGAELFQQVKLAEPERSKALAVLDSFCEKSDRIFVRMLLLSAMMDLGLPEERCLDVCQTGLRQEEYYYRLQAARLLGVVAERFPGMVNADELMGDKDLGVRVYAARIHWRNHKRPEAVLPVFIEALDRKKYQSYYYDEILNAALGGLGDLGSEARPARTNLATIIEDPNPQVAALAKETMRKMGE
ncbi:MAG TPA: HEAT repeat domain-containing protein [Verrucomicrobiae bacterium]|nr:HEAT repeat domain-containing protein [Verrucomicrobiae bacterium]